MGVNTNITFKEIDAKHLYQAEYDQFLKNVELKMNKKENGTIGKKVLMIQIMDHQLKISINYFSKYW